MFFITQTGIVVAGVTAKQMAEIDRLTTEETGPNLYQMMENAGRNLCLLTLEELGNNLSSSAVLVLAGKGGNGGGGICAARHLDNHGADVTLCLTETKNLNTVTAYQMHILKSTGVKVISPEELDRTEPDIILDAMIGYNLSGSPRGNALKMIQWTARQKIPVISLDVPSGVNATTGRKAKYHIRPVITLTLALPKTGLIPDVTGTLYLADIGIPEQVYSKMNIPYTRPFSTGYYVHIFQHGQERTTGNFSDHTFNCKTNTNRTK